MAGFSHLKPSKTSMFQNLERKGIIRRTHQEVCSHPKCSRWEATVTYLNVCIKSLQATPAYVLTAGHFDKCKHLVTPSNSIIPSKNTNKHYKN